MGDTQNEKYFIYEFATFFRILITLLLLLLLLCSVPSSAWRYLSINPGVSRCLARSHSVTYNIYIHAVSFKHQYLTSYKYLPDSEATFMTTCSSLLSLQVVYSILFNHFHLKIHFTNFWFLNKSTTLCSTPPSRGRTRQLPSLFYS